jgi:hypothetical protein
VTGEPASQSAGALVPAAPLEALAESWETRAEEASNDPLASTVVAARAAVYADCATQLREWLRTTPPYPFPD